MLQNVFSSLKIDKEKLNVNLNLTTGMNTKVWSESFNKAAKTMIEPLKIMEHMKPFKHYTPPKRENVKFMKRIESIIKRATEYGWTATGMFSSQAYFESGRLPRNIDLYDSHFLKSYEENDGFVYKKVKKDMLTKINKINKRILKQCFYNYERNHYEVSIPSLIMLIEGEIANMGMSDRVGKSLLIEVEHDISTMDDDIKKIIARTTVRFFKDNLFDGGDFNNVYNGIKRNRIMHGRDDPSKWRKVDALKLITNLSTLLTINEEVINKRKFKEVPPHIKHDVKNLIISKSKCYKHNRNIENWLLRIGGRDAVSEYREIIPKIENKMDLLVFLEKFHTV